MAKQKTRTNCEKNTSSTKRKRGHKYKGTWSAQYSNENQTLTKSETKWKTAILDVYSCILASERYL